MKPGHKSKTLKRNNRQRNMNFLYNLIFLSFILLPFAKAEERKVVSTSEKKPLVLQWEVSHSRNRDQISLIFRQKYVELVTNTSSYQKGKITRLGRFKSPLNSELKTLRDQIKWYYVQLRKTVPVSSLIKDSRFQATVRDPHAPVLRINEEEVKDGQTYFKPLANIIYKVWEHKWTCIECASYKQQKEFIIRTMKKMNLRSTTVVKTKGSDKTQKQWKTSKQKLPKKLLNCVPKGKSRVECVDPQFGIFEI